MSEVRNIIWKKYRKNENNKAGSPKELKPLQNLSWSLNLFLRISDFSMENKGYEAEFPLLWEVKLLIFLMFR